MGKLNNKKRNNTKRITLQEMNTPSSEREKEIFDPYY